MINILKGFFCFCEECKGTKNDFNLLKTKNDIIINDSYETISFDSNKKKVSNNNNEESITETSDYQFTSIGTYPKLYFTFTKQKPSKKSIIPLSDFKHNTNHKIKDIRKNLMDNLY